MRYFVWETVLVAFTLAGSAVPGPVASSAESETGSVSLAPASVQQYLGHQLSQHASVYFPGDPEFSSLVSPSHILFPPTLNPYFIIHKARGLC